MTAELGRLRILVAEPDDFSFRARQILEQIGDVELRSLAQSGLPAALADFDVVWFRLGLKVGRDSFPPNPRCRILATPVTGLDRIDLDTCRENGVRVVSLKGETEFLQEVRATAELTVALTLALMRRIVPASRSVLEEGVWNRDRFRGHELYGKTAGIVGLGRLGGIVAGYFRSLGMEVIGCDPRAPMASPVERVGDLLSLLRRSDVVSLHVPYDSSNHHLLGRREMDAMKAEGVLVNTSRGGVVDEVALLDALKAGSIAGATLDVLTDEPEIHLDHPLLEYAREHDNLLIVPHIGGNTYESFEKTEVFLAERVLEALRDPAAAR